MAPRANEFWTALRQRVAGVARAQGDAERDRLAALCDKYLKRAIREAEARISLKREKRR